MKNFVINIATVNGSGSQTANTVLLRSLFRMGVPVGGKNVFPSNIAGLPTWFWIRANDKGHVGTKALADIVVSLNPQTFEEDQKCLPAGGFFFFSDEKVDASKVRTDVNAIAIPFKKLTDQLKAPVKIKKLAGNMIYVGILAELLKIPSDVILKTIQDQLGGKASAVEPNLQALEVGRNFATNDLAHLTATGTGVWKFKAEGSISTKEKVLMDGNTAAALGLISGGCQFVSWYPITPSTSLVEAFQKFAPKVRQDGQGKNKFACVQSEDELSAFSMVLGAGWAGTRAMTATSGPGLSLMAEGAGYAYFAEVPSVIWDVQRMGPSTGLPTRNSQGDVLFAATLSHGDTKHILLFPGSLQECFEFGQVCFDLAERLQQLVIVLSDLDLGMNLWMSDQFVPLEKKYDRGNVLNADKLNSDQPFYRYQEQANDGIPNRTIIGNSNPKAAYFTRGSGHNFKAQYTESGVEYEKNMQRLERKWETAKTLVPKPIIENNGSSEGVLFFGSTNAVMDEVSEELSGKTGKKLNLCRVRAYPFTAEVEEFVKQNKNIFVVEQNRDAQMKTLLLQAFPEHAMKFKSVLHYSGAPISSDVVFAKIQSLMGASHV